MKLTTWLFGLPLAVIAVAFSVANRGPITLDLWPLPFTAEAKVFMLVLVPLAAGVVFGGLVSWFLGGKTRSKLRQTERRLMNLEREMAIKNSQVPDKDATKAKSDSKSLIAAE